MSNWSFTVRRGCPSFEPPQGGRIASPRCLRPPTM